MGFEAWPLLSSYPHPPEFIDWMRQVFANPQPFIDEVITIFTKTELLIVKFISVMYSVLVKPKSMDTMGII